MSRLQQTADAQSVLNQRTKKKRSRKSKKKGDQDGESSPLILSTNYCSHISGKMAVDLLRGAICSLLTAVYSSIMYTCIYLVMARNVFS